MESGRGPLEEEIYEMTRADLPPGAGSMDASQMVVMLLNHLNKIEEAILRLAKEIDGLRAA